MKTERNFIPPELTAISRITNCPRNGAYGGVGDTNLPLWLPARRKEEMALMIPKMSCDKIVLTFPCLGSGWRRVRRDPEAVMICCSFVPENCPSSACVMFVGG